MTTETEKIKILEQQIELLRCLLGCCMINDGIPEEAVRSMLLDEENKLDFDQYLTDEKITYPTDTPIDEEYGERIFNRVYNESDLDLDDIEDDRRDYWE